MQHVAEKMQSTEDAIFKRFVDSRGGDVLDTKTNRNDNAMLTLATLDRLGISLEKYGAIASLPGGDGLSRLHAIKGAKRKLNARIVKLFGLKTVTLPFYGVWIPPRLLLLFLLRENPLLEGEDILRLSLGGDGRNMDRHHQQTIITVRILNPRRVGFS